jgi:HAD superfamily hydrolase (TIGR01509 family)
VIAAVVFDLDGVLVDSEAAWDAARRELVQERGGMWKDSATRDMLGMSSPEWSRYVADELGVDLPPDEISARVLEQLLDRYRRRLPLIPGATEAVERLAAKWPLGLASSSNRGAIDLVLAESGLDRYFEVSISSEEVGAGKPAPDVYLEAARQLNASPGDCLAIEDSENGIRSARTAEMSVIAIPNHDFPPPEDALALADHVAGSLDELSPELVERVAASAVG